MNESKIKDHEILDLVRKWQRSQDDRTLLLLFGDENDDHSLILGDSTNILTSVIAVMDGNPEFEKLVRTAIRYFDLYKLKNNSVKMQTN